MTDPRPRPQYGEYATPQEQAKAMGVEYVPTPPPAAVPVAAAPAGASTPSAPAQHPVTPHTSDEPAERPQRSWNLMLTVTLLTLGGLSVLQSFAGYVDLAATIDAAAERIGAGDFTASASTRPIGIAIAVSSVVIYLITLAISVALLRARRLAFWVPLAGAALWGLLTVILMAVAIMGDPTFVNTFTNQ